MAPPCFPRLARRRSRGARPLQALVALGLILSPGLAGALTPAEVWAEMQRIAVAGGQVPRASSERAGDGTLTLDGVSIAAGADGPTRATTLIDRIVLTGNADGSVGIAYPGGYQIVLESVAGTGVDRAVLDLGTENLRAVARGAVGDLTLAYAADTATLRLAEFSAADGSQIPDFLLAVTDLSLTSRFAGTENRVSAQAREMSFEIGVIAADNAGRLAAEYRLTAPTLTSTGSALAMSAASDLAQLAADGTPYAFDFRHQGMALGVTTEASGVTGGLAASVATGGSRATLLDGILDLAASAEGVNLQALSNRLPAPLSARADAATVSGAVPVVPGADSQPVALAVTLDALVLGDEVWALVDPGAHLPRDPAQLRIDLEGQARVSDGLASLPLPPRPMLDLEQVTINAFTLSAAGARLQAEGDVAIDRTRPGPLPGMPGMIGRLALAASGTDALLNGLASAGILQPSDTMGLRMMMGMLTRPGSAPDTLTSEIELTPEGSVIANGMQLR